MVAATVFGLSAKRKFQSITCLMTISSRNVCASVGLIASHEPWTNCALCITIALRKAGSAWSKVNKARVESLINCGLMASAGLALVDPAKADGTWSFLDDVDEGVAPPDLVDALSRFPIAMAHFDAFPPSSKKIILEWIKMAKRPETRAKRVQGTAKKVERNERANYYRRSGTKQAAAFFRSFQTPNLIPFCHCRY